MFTLTIKDISYLSRYYALREWKEEDESELRRSWRLRQVAVYHSFSGPEDAHTFVLLLPEQNGAIQSSLEQIIGCHDHTDIVLSRPMLVHALLFAAHSDNWRTVLKERGDQFSDNENLFAQDMEDLQLDVRFDRMQFWRDLEDRLAPLEPLFLALLSQLEVLQRCDTFLTHANQTGGVAGAEERSLKALPAEYFRSRMNLVKGLMTSAQGLQKRIHNASRLVENTLELRNQSELKAINENLLKLQRENLDDSETVKVITILTMIYLPASFVTSLFGMNVFDYDGNSHKMETARNWWIYLAVWIPLTVVTILLWQLAVLVMKFRRTAQAKKAARRSVQGSGVGG
ncbi:hypothetical protein H2200_001249 [Cladophialophora chaetospira]|uniref:Mg2+ transporter protein, CorA-like/Zinc transport protein ZntB n=1 Tax=Cladophialophora chaetospira TaxID=386627 RepID=A0AA39CPE8_9EURO|nr:hypothetical protein H2200_001249 [Cladophialophora chaetospira]